MTDTASSSVYQSPLLAAVSRFCPRVYFDKSERYYPSSFPYWARHARLTRSGKPVFPNGGDQASQVAAAIQSELDGNGGDDQVRLLWSGSTPDERLLLDMGPHQGADGYAGKPNPTNPLYGDPHAPEQVITAYCIGTFDAPNGTRFADVCYTVYFMWNGTSEYHAGDVEEIVLRLQYYPAQMELGHDESKGNDYGDGSGYRVSTELLEAQGIPDPRGEWAIARVYLSCHGNGMWYPTKFPGAQDRSMIEFDGNHPVIYSALGSHAMYPAAGRQRRIFGFGDDFTRRDMLWMPTHVSLWLGTGPPQLRQVDHYVLPVDGNQPLQNPDDPLLALAYFGGNFGNPENNQNVVPLKDGVMNLVSQGDFYYKFQQGGSDNAIRFALSPTIQLVLLVVGTILSILGLVGMVFLQNGLYDLACGVVTGIGVMLVSLLLTIGSVVSIGQILRPFADSN